MNRLSTYRSIEGLNQQELGHLLDLSPQMISAIESGRRQFSGSLLPLGYRDDRFRVPEMSEPLHRHRSTTRVSSKQRAKELLRLAGEVFGELVERTPKAPSFQMERLPIPRSLEDVEDYAVDVRCSLRVEESGPIQNLTALVERAGICLVPIFGLDGIDGLSAWVDDTPVIGLSPSVPGDRFRLTLGHELAHLLFHQRKGDTTENEANRFAAALLIPTADFDAAMPSQPQLRDFIQLKNWWGISVAALVYRAHELDYIDDKRYRALQIQMSKWRRSEPGEFDPATAKLFSKLIEVNGGVDSVASDLGINRTHLSELADWRRLRLI